MPKSIPNPASVYYREPRLLMPGRKPAGPVKIDWSSSLSEDLQAFTLLDGVAGSGMDLVANKPLSFNDQHATSILGGNQALEIERSGQGDAAFFQPPGRFYTSVTTEMTAIVRCRFNATTSYGSMLSVPHAATGWVRPWSSLIFQRSASSSQSRFFLTQDGDFRFALSATGYITANIQTYAVIFDAAATNRASFYRDGEFFSQTTGSILNASIGWNTKNPAVFGNVSHNGQSLESDEIEIEFSMIYARVLKDRELREIHADPYQFVLSK